MTNKHIAPERIIGDGVAEDISAALDRHGLGKKLLLVADPATWTALGERVFNTHRDRYDITHHALEKQPKALMELARQIIDAAKDMDGLLAVGSGTINDLTKYAAHELKKPYIVLATAASMNGYTSAGVSLMENGFKQSYLATPPKAVIVDMKVIIAAPKRLTRAGLGDTLARSTVEADCILSHHLRGTPYPKEGFDVLRAHERELFNDTTRLTRNDPTYLRALIDALLEAGDWMAKIGSSAIASQAEHMIAHTAEMLYPLEVRYAFHGEVVGITTIAVSQLQQRILLRDVSVRALPYAEDKFIRIFGKKLGPPLVPIYARKVLSEEEALHINEKLKTEWPGIKAQLMKIMKSPLTLERAFLQANLPILPRSVGLNDDSFNGAMTYAHMTRERFTFLDVAAMMGKRI